MSFAYRGITHCTKCGKVLKMNEISICKDCEKRKDISELETYKKIANYMAGWLKFFSNSEKSEKELLEWAEKAVENVQKK